MNSLTLHYKRISEFGLVYAIGTFPAVKLLSLYLNIPIPAHYLFIVFFTSILTFNQLFRKNRPFYIINLYLALYCVVAWFNSTAPLNMSNYKIFLAAFTYSNLILVLFQISKSNDSNKYATIYLDLLAYSSILFFLLMTISTTLLCLKHPFDWSSKNILGLFTFSRDQIAFRSTLITRINPLGLITNDLTNIGYIGPQLLIQPLIYTLLKITGLTKSLTQKAPKFLDVIIYVSLGIYILTLNTRAFLLIISIFAAIKYIKLNISHIKHFATLLLFLFPFSIYLLNSKSLSMRDCQFNFVKNQLSRLGNGIGYDINALNTLCAGDNIHVAKYIPVLTLSYDNIHLEFIHYFGYLTYIATLVFIFLNTRSNKNYLYLMSFLFVFMALNFNLFEVVFAPFLLILFINTFNYSKGKYPSNAT